MQILDEPSVEIDNNLTNEWILFIQKEESHYINAWDKFSKGGSKRSFNLGAALGGPLWAGYRKMYLYLPFNAFLLMIQLPLQQHIPFFSEFPILVWLVLLGNPIFFGFWGDFLYYKLATKKINKVSKLPNKELLLKQAGGVDLSFFIVGPVIAFVIMIVLLFLFLATGLVVYEWRFLG